MKHYINTFSPWLWELNQNCHTKQMCHIYDHEPEDTFTACLDKIRGKKCNDSYCDALNCVCVASVLVSHGVEQRLYIGAGLLSFLSILLNVQLDIQLYV